MNRLLLEKKGRKRGEGGKKGREEKKGRKGKKKGRSLYGNHLPARSAPPCKVKIPTNQLICFHRSLHSISLFDIIDSKITRPIGFELKRERRRVSLCLTYLMAINLSLSMTLK